MKNWETILAEIDKLSNVDKSKLSVQELLILTEIKGALLWVVYDHELSKAPSDSLNFLKEK